MLAMRQHDSTWKDWSLTPTFPKNGPGQTVRRGARLAPFWTQGGLLPEPIVFVPNRLAHRRCRVLLPCRLLATLALALLYYRAGLAAQGPAQTQTYVFQRAAAADAARVLNSLLGPETAGVEIRVDAAKNQLVVVGPAETQRMAQQLVEALDRPTTGTGGAPPAAVLRSYPIAAGNLADAAARLQSQIPADLGAQISVDEANAQLLVWGPDDLQQRVPEWLAGRAAANSPWRRVQVVPLTEARCQQIEPILSQMLSGRLTARSAPNDDSAPHSYALGGFAAGTVELLFDRRTNQVILSGPAAALGQVERLLKALDSPKGQSGHVTRIMPLGGANLGKVRQAVDAYRGNNAPSSDSPRDDDPQARRNWSPIRPASQRGAAPVQLANRQVPDDGAAADEGVDAERQRLQELGADVEVESLPDLDVIILRGNQRDVDEVIRIVQEIERLSAQAEPQIELVTLEHVGSEKMTEIVNRLKPQMLSTRPGTASVTALVKPNAVLVIGWGDAMTATLELVKKLDQPVEASTQLRVFPLKHAPSVAVQKTVEDFFAKRTGLGAKVTVAADARTNSLIVQADPNDLREVELLLAKIDTGQSAVQNELRVFRLKNTLASDLGPVLQTAIGGGSGAAAATPQSQNVRSLVLKFLTIDAQGQKVLESGLLSEVKITPDPKTNSLLVSAPPESMELLAALVHELDSSPTGVAQIKVFTIVNGDAAALVEMLRALLDVPGAGTGPQLAGAEDDASLAPLRFSVDVRTNSIIASGSAADLSIVEAILLRLDSSDTQERRSIVYRLKNAPAQNVAQAVNEFLRSERLVQQALPGGVSGYRRIETEVVVVPEFISNSLIVSATPRYYDEIIRLIDGLDAQPPQVMIQVLIAEVELNALDEFGVELGLQDGVLFDRSVLETTSSPTATRLNPGYTFNNKELGNGTGVPNDAAIVGAQGLTSFALQRVSDASGTPGFGGLVLGASSRSVSLLLRALSENRRMDVLSRPQIMTLDNQPALVQVGQRVPRIANTSIVGLNQNFGVELYDVGLILGVTPRISPEGLIVMEVDATKSAVDPTVSTVIGFQAGSPLTQTGFTVTQAQTTVSASDGETIVLGGLITESDKTRQRRIPWLSDVPVLGNFFRYDQSIKRRTELLFILTPHIVRNEADANRIKQMETARMSWCLADVYRVHGDIGLADPNQMLMNDATTVVYPDIDPRGQGMPAPNGQPLHNGPSMESVPSGPGAPAHELPAPSSPATNAPAPAPGPEAKANSQSKTAARSSRRTWIPSLARKP